MKKFKSGEYVYIPSDVTMYLYDKKYTAKANHGRASTFTKTTKTKSPSRLMFVATSYQNSEFCEVFYEGCLWTVHSDSVYKSKSGEDDER